MTDTAILNAGWLGDLPRDFADALIRTGRWTQVNRGKIVYGIGSDDTDLYGIAQGTARMHMAINEHEQRLSHIVGPGFWFGEYEFLSGIPRLLEFEAATELRLFQITGNDFRRLALKFPDAWKWIALLTGQHLNLAMGAVDDLMLSSAERRLAAVLLRLSGHRLGHPASPSIDVIPATQQELAVAANLSRASAGKILRLFEKKAEILIEYGGLTILDAHALTARIQ